MVTSPSPRPARVVVITGASSGIARATALAFAARGAHLVLAARDAEALGQVAAECDRAGGKALSVPTDVTDEAAVTGLARRAHDVFGGIDVWVNAAAVMAYGEFERVPADVYRHIIETNLFGQIHGARAALPYFRERGAGVLVNVASVWGAVTSPYVSAYVTSKFGVRAFSDCLHEALRLERATRDIHVCTILPQSVDTPIFQHAANYTGHESKPVPPVIDPRRVVRAILRSVDHPRRRRTVGVWGRLIEIGHEFAPGLFGKAVPTVMNVAALGQRGVADTTGNVVEPMSGWNQTDGHWRNTPLRIGVAVAGGVAAVGAGIGAGALWRGRRRAAVSRRGPFAAGGAG